MSPDGDASPCHQTPTHSATDTSEMAITKAEPRTPIRENRRASGTPSRAQAEVSARHEDEVPLTSVYEFGGPLGKRTDAVS